MADHRTIILIGLCSLTPQLAYAEKHKSNALLFSDYQVQSAMVITLKDTSRTSFTITLKQHYNDLGKLIKEIAFINDIKVWQQTWDHDTYPIERVIDYSWQQLIENKMQTIIDSLEFIVTQTTYASKSLTRKTTHMQDTTLSSTTFPLLEKDIAAERYHIYQSNITTQYHDEKDDIYTFKYNDIEEITYLGKTTVSYQENNHVLTDCAQFRYLAPWLDFAETRTYCRNYGLVQFANYRLVSIE